MLLLLLQLLLVLASCSPPRCDPTVRGKLFLFFLVVDTSDRHANLQRLESKRLMLY